MSFRKLGFSEASLLLKRFLYFLLFGHFFLFHSIEMFPNLSNDRLYIFLRTIWRKKPFFQFHWSERKLINWLNIFQEQFRNINRTTKQKICEFINFYKHLALSIFNKSNFLNARKIQLLQLQFWSLFFLIIICKYI